MGIWNSIKGVFQDALQLLHDGMEPLFGDQAWGWSIIALTLIVRVFLLPLAIKQTRSMRAMQALQPKIKQLQKKYKVDRDLMRKDPETYKSRKSKLNEEMMALYKEEGVNPASGCLPLVLQAPIFLALFQVLRDFDPLKNAPFYFFTDQVAVGNENGSGLGAFVSEVGWPGWLLIVLMSATMFWSQRQMMARNAGTTDGTAQQQQKIMMYVMPVFLAFISFNFPLGVLLYWVTTNLWQMGQQAVILREVKQDVAEETTQVIEKKPKGSATSKDAKPAASRPSGAKPSASEPSKPSPASKLKEAAKRAAAASGTSQNKADRGSTTGPAGGPSSNGQNKRKREHLPKRGDAANR
jgi:YidC/Oxa1 family membrane protein insertase